ncbi:MAG TPA: M1 family aminopeptidase [Candidatus Eisenbacteria bacterium]|nr:M1 family aminopeptidase [Candidatus Eisenbacteria bacterium]
MGKALAAALGVLCGAALAMGQATGGGGVWNALSAPTMDPAKLATVENVAITRDRLHITLVNGTIQFTKPVNDVVFGAVFHGTGRVQVDPPNALEAQQLRWFTKVDKLNAEFTDATFTFSDGLLEEVTQQVKWRDATGNDELFAKRQQEREDLGAGYLPRIFKAAMSPDRKRTAYFLAELKIRDHGWIEVRDDAMLLEEIRVGRWSDVGPFKLKDYWMVFPANGRDARHAYDDPAARQDFLIPSYKIEATVSDNAELAAKAAVTVEPRFDGERVLLFDLDSNLRLQSVKDEQGRSLEFHQARERKEDSQSHGKYVAVVLAEPAKTGKSEVLTFEYGGKHVVYRVGDGNYFCQSFGWYPSSFEPELGVDAFAFRSNFDLTFRTPKRYILVATGEKTGETKDGKEVVTTWKSEMPLAAAGFAFGDYKVVTDKVGNVEVEVYANREPDDLLKGIQKVYDNPLDDLAQGPGAGASHSSTGVIGTLTPAALGKTINIETGNTLRVFQSYFGPYPYKEIAVTNIVGTYGQGWPGLLYLSWLTFLDSTQRNELGIKNQKELTDFFRGHESSHQWWGHKVGWKSYHDQWLSEGFAEFSGLLYLQYRENVKSALTEWRLRKERLKEVDEKGHSVDSLGPIWIGQRAVASITSPSAYQNLIYSKGGYVLQMLRMQMQDPRSPDAEHLFKAMMQDYCQTFDNKAASTEDFKAIVEKHMTRGMDLDGNHKMGWFFDEYVYGTEIPQYTFHATLGSTPDGKTTVNATLQRTGVPGNWKDVVPLYAHMGDKTVRLGSIAATHDTENINFTLPQKIDKVSIADYEDLLADVKE